jgi:hypothetical protein
VGRQSAEGNISIFNADGRVVMQLSVEDVHNCELDLELLPSGWYTAVVKTQGGEASDAFEIRR